MRDHLGPAPKLDIINGTCGIGYARLCSTCPPYEKRDAPRCHECPGRIYANPVPKVSGEDEALLTEALAGMELAQ